MSYTNTYDPQPIPTFVEKYRSRQAHEAARWIAEALGWITLYVSPDEAFTAEELLPSIAEDGDAPACEPVEAFPFVLELAATLAGYAMSALTSGAPPNEFQERQARSALAVILGDDHADLLE
jgi:hypothetical protein